MVEGVVGDEAVILAVVTAVVVDAPGAVSDGARREGDARAGVEESVEMAGVGELDVGGEPEEGAGEGREGDEQRGEASGWGGCGDGPSIAAGR
jgi:hypothetical protein